jgi:hypothetical protein
MNDPALAVRKLKELMKMATAAQTDYEKAAIYAATRWLTADLQAESDQQRLGLGEAILRVRESIGGITGFDIGEDKSHQSHLTTSAMGFRVLEAKFNVL